MKQIPPNLAPTAAIVCVPACNEAERVGRLLSSLAAQSMATGADPLKVVVLSNNSRDGTGQVVRTYERDSRLELKLIEETLDAEQAHAGMARRLAMDAGADWFETEAFDGALLSTDADAVVPCNWVAANLAALASADLVGGRLVIGNEHAISIEIANLHARVARYWAAVRSLEDLIDPSPHDPSPRHGDHTGASIALRVSLYRAVGGVPPLASGEDNALVEAVTRFGGRVRHCPNVWVEVSSREIGRAAQGMAHEMVRRRKVVASNQSYHLPSADFWRARLSRRAEWRAQWPKDGAAFRNAIAYVADREARADACIPPMVPIDIAIADLEALAQTTVALA